MASEKVTEVEMEKISPAEERESEDAEKGKVRETKAEEKEAENPEGKEDKEKEDDDPLYSKLNNPTEDVYSLARMPGSPRKDQKDVYRKVRLYRRLCVALLIVCVVLLAVLLALAVKLSEAQSSQRYQPAAESSTAPASCSLQTCEALFPTLMASHHSGEAGEPQHVVADNHAGLVCSECGKGWLKYDDSCYLLSRVRRTWQESREECLKLGGDLTVIRSERVQRFLTNKGLMQYWIGLHRSETQEWTWINNTALTTGYWATNLQEGNCVFLNGGKWHKGNWHSSRCELYSNYICQRG
ncbi:C-type lectin domain family 1 member B isoform X1 [Pygocentrus nattereri]|nr:C-type lectin domain family 1 member B isoform X1 [Pygocentrus nattereri]XP_037392936.1 C-type lectin domain family 1 member B isoform X1 [Pygocentrus nattereri]